MKHRSTTPVSKGLVTKSVLVAAAVVMAVSAPLSMMPKAYADKYDDQINALKSDIAQFQAEAGKLGRKADTLQAELAKINAEKAIIQGQIDLSQAQYDKLKQQIKETEVKIADNKDALGITIANLYVDDSISPLEMLASSSNIGDYVDKQTYRTAMSDELQGTIDKIDTLKRELEKKKKSVELVLKNQQAQRETLQAKEAEKQELISKTRGKEAAYQALSSQKNAEVNKLREAQKAEMARRQAAVQSSFGGFTISAGDPNKGGYPSNLANAPQNSIAPDPWGMFNRQCVSYAAWKVDQAYGNMPYWGNVPANATNWPNLARQKKYGGFKTGSTPKKHSVAVLHDGSYGHVAWVERVNPDGSIYISQYNWNWSGDYSEMTLPASFFQEYIYFGG